jgi:hypothetical protein
MGCKVLEIEYYESLAEKGISSLFLPAKPLHKKTPIGYFSNIAILSLKYFNPQNCKWLSRDPINEKGGLNLYGFVGNNPVNTWDYNGMQLFGSEGDQTISLSKELRIFQVHRMFSPFSSTQYWTAAKFKFSMTFECKCDNRTYDLHKKNVKSTKEKVWSGTAFFSNQAYWR